MATTFNTRYIREQGGGVYGAPVRRLGYSRWEADLVKSSQQLVSRFWSRSREVRFKRKSERVRAVMRKRETIEPR